MFGSGAYAKIWNVEDKGSYTVVELSTSRKKKDSDEYETDFSSKFVRFVGAAHEDARKLKGNERIKLANCGVTNSYVKEKEKEYVNYVVFSFETLEDNSKSTKTSTKKTSVEDDEDDLPF